MMSSLLINLFFVFWWISHFPSCPNLSCSSPIRCWSPYSRYWNAAASSCNDIISCRNGESNAFSLDFNKWTITSCKTPNVFSLWSRWWLYSATSNALKFGFFMSPHNVPITAFGCKLPGSGLPTPGTSLGSKKSRSRVMPKPYVLCWTICKASPKQVWKPRL